MSNYPPGVSGAPYQRGVYKYSCADHGTSYGHGYFELGGFFLEDDAVARCNEAVEGEWVHVYATQCEKHGRWTEKEVYHQKFDFEAYETIEIVWECPEGHLLITEDY